MTIIKSLGPPNLVISRKKVDKLESLVSRCAPLLEKHLINLKKNLENLEQLENVDEINEGILKAKKEFSKYLWLSKESERGTFVPDNLKSIARLKSGEYGTIGRRNTMEDQVVLFDDLNSVSQLLSPNVNRAMYAVYDGHAGAEVSTIAKDRLHLDIIWHLAALKNGKAKDYEVFNALKMGLKTTDEFVGKTEGIKSGCTVILVYIHGERLYTANLGDAEAILGRKNLPTPTNPNPSPSYCPILLSKKHKPDDYDEKNRLLSLGAVIARGRVFALAVSRSLGDCAYKMPATNHDYISNDPYLSAIDLIPGVDQFLVLACDGLWDCVKYQEAVDFVSEELMKGKDCTEIAKGLADLSFEKGSTDNISVIVVVFKWKVI